MKRRTILIFFLSGVVAVLALAGYRSQTMRDAIAVGDEAPGFTLVGSDGETYSLESFRGVRPVVLAWFPKSSTPG